MRASVQQAVPGGNFHKFPAGITGKGKHPVKTKACPERLRCISDKLATRLATAPPALKIFKEDVEKYDPSPGCSACTEIITGREDNKHTITQNIPRNNDCRARMTGLMRQDEDDKARLEKAEGRHAKFQEELDATKAKDESGRNDDALKDKESAREV